MIDRKGKKNKVFCQINDSCLVFLYPRVSGMISRYVVMAQELRQPPCPCYITTTAGRHVSVPVPVCSLGDFDMTFHSCSGLCPLWELSTSEESGLG